MRSKALIVLATTAAALAPLSILAPAGAADGAAGTPSARAAATCAGLQATIVGTAGNDVLVGTSGPDVIAGLGGQDTIRGFGGNDVICGGEGNDFLDGGAGNDRIYGGMDRVAGENRPYLVPDRLIGGTGNDLLNGGYDSRLDHYNRPPSDIIDFANSAQAVVVDLAKGTARGQGRDRIVSQPRLQIVGSGFADKLYGDRGDNLLAGGNGNDLIVGRGGNDFLRGDGLALNDNAPQGLGRDRLLGGIGEDILEGGPRADVLDGGRGVDQLVDDGRQGRDIFRAGPGNDLLLNTSSARREVAEGGSGHDRLTVLPASKGSTIRPMVCRSIEARSPRRSC